MNRTLLELKEYTINYPRWDIRETFIEEVANRMGLKEWVGKKKKEGVGSGLAHG